MTYKKHSFLFLFLSLFLCSSCDKVFEYSLYSADVKDERKFTRDKHLDELQDIEAEVGGQTSFKFALLSDSHTFYNSLADIVDLINQDEESLFVIHGGDMTDGGMITEYTIFYQIMDKLNKPYFTAIGNHDCLANGRTIYNDQYGPENYSFVFKNCKFVFLNNVIWELNYEEPDFTWLANELRDNSEYDRVFVVSHIPPWSDQFSALDTWAFRNIMDSTNVDVSIHGHHHDHSYEEFFGDSVEYLVIGAPSKNIYCTFTVEPDTLILETIYF